MTDHPASARSRSRRASHALQDDHPAPAGSSRPRLPRRNGRQPRRVDALAPDVASAANKVSYSLSKRSARIRGGAGSPDQPSSSARFERHRSSSAIPPRHDRPRSPGRRHTQSLLPRHLPHELLCSAKNLRAAHPAISRDRDHGSRCRQGYSCSTRIIWVNIQQYLDILD
jgi:hypothetical protein